MFILKIYFHEIVLNEISYFIHDISNNELLCRKFNLKNLLDKNIKKIQKIQKIQNKFR